MESLEFDRFPARSLLGWVVVGYPDEALVRILEPGRVHEWGDSRGAGKHPGQKVLFLQTGGPVPRWVGWGKVLEPAESWRVLGTRTICDGRFDPPLPAWDPVNPRPGGGDWEIRSLAATLGLSSFRERTPYLDNDARDHRLTARDCHRLLEMQPALAQAFTGKEEAVPD